MKRFFNLKKMQFFRIFLNKNSPLLPFCGRVIIKRYSIFKASLPFFILLIFVNCENYELAQNNFFYLDAWEINIGDGYKKGKAIFWEASTYSGGLGVEHDGFGYYRTYFNIPENLYDRQLGFYSECIDDADIIYLNEKIIGKTGQFPVSSNSGTGFQSATREARLYVLPQKLLYKENNKIVIKVYDFSGLGGFCYLQKPIIGDYSELFILEKNHKLHIDLPRTSCIISLLIIGLYLLILSIFGLRYIPIKEYYNILKDNYNILRFFRFNPIHAIYNLDSILHVRYLHGFFLCYSCAFFLLSETTYKYMLIKSEIFWFKVPPVIFVFGFSNLIVIFHNDVFGEKFNFRHKLKLARIPKLISSTITHPFCFILFMGYISLLPANKVWSTFTIYGLFYFFILQVVLFGYVAIQIFKLKIGAQDLNLKRILYREASIRLIFLGGLVLSNYIFIQKGIFFFNAMLFMVIFLIIFYIESILFMTLTRIRLPYIPSTVVPIFIRLQTDYKLTYTEAKIAELIETGISKDLIVSKLNISPETMKKHLQSIYDKTIDQEGIWNRGEKFQKLTLFLKRLSE